MSATSVLHPPGEAGKLLVASLAKLTSAAGSLTRRIEALGSKLKPDRVNQLFASVANQESELKKTNVQLGEIAGLLRGSDQLRREEMELRRTRDQDIRKQLNEVRDALKPLGLIRTAVEQATELSQRADDDRVNVLKAIAASFNGVGKQETRPRVRVGT